MGAHREVTMDSKQTGKGKTQNTGRDWSDEVEQLLQDWRQRVYAAQSAHYASADRFRLLNYVVGVPAVVFSSVVGTAIFPALRKTRPRLRWLLWPASSLRSSPDSRHSCGSPSERRIMQPPPIGTQLSDVTSRGPCTSPLRFGVRPRTASTKSAKK